MPGARAAPAAHGEHVDDHQIQIARELAQRGLALSVEADELTLEHLLDAAGRRVQTLPVDPPFVTLGASAPATAGSPAVLDGIQEAA